MNTPNPAAQANFSVCLHGIDATAIKFDTDKVNDALYLYLDKDHEVSVRVDTRPKFAGEREANRVALYQLAEQALAMIGALEDRIVSDGGELEPIGEAGAPAPAPMS